MVLEIGKWTIYQQDCFSELRNVMRSIVVQLAKIKVNLKRRTNKIMKMKKKIPKNSTHKMTKEKTLHPIFSLKDLQEKFWRIRRRKKMNKKNAFVIVKKHNV